MGRRLSQESACCVSTGLSTLSTAHFVTHKSADRINTQSIQRTQKTVKETNDLILKCAMEFSKEEIKMAKKYLKSISSLSLATRKMQNKITLEILLPLTLVRMTKI